VESYLCVVLSRGTFFGAIKCIAQWRRVFCGLKEGVLFGEQPLLLRGAFAAAASVAMRLFEKAFS